MEGLADVIDLIKQWQDDLEPPAATAPLAATAAAPTAPATPAAPQAEPAVTALEWWWNQTVPYTADGVIDWGKLEEGIPAADADDEFDCEIKRLDFGKPLPSNLHPYYHPHPDNECCIVGHKCNCPKCRGVVELASPMRKRSKQAVDPPIMVDASPVAPSLATTGGTPSIFAKAAGTTPTPAATAKATPAATAKASKTKKRPIEKSPEPVGIVVPENVLGHIETLADTADMPETAQKEREASTTEKGKPKGSSSRRRYPTKTRPPPPEEPADDTPLIETPVAETIVDTLVDSQPAGTAKVPKGIAKKRQQRQRQRQRTPATRTQFRAHTRCTTAGSPWKNPSATSWARWPTNRIHSSRMSRSP